MTSPNENRPATPRPADAVWDGAPASGDADHGGAEPRAAGGGAEGGAAERGRPGGGGRPKKAPGEARSERVYVSLKPGESGAVKRAAAGAGLSVSAYARRRLLGKAVAPLEVSAKIDGAQAELRRSAVELSRVGVNLNQLARWANEGAPAERAAPPTGPAGSAAGWAALEAEVRAAINEVESATRALGRAADGGDGRVRGEGPTYVRRVTDDGDGGGSGTS